MEYIKLGNSGLSIAPIIVGCMSYGSKTWQDWLIEDEDEVMKLLKKAYDMGLRTFDTADVYSNGKSEILLGKFIKMYNIPRDKIVILSKCFFTVDESIPDFSFHDLNSDKYPSYEYANSVGLSRKHIFDAVEGSIKRLGTYMDVLQIHRLDKGTPKKEIMKALHDVIEKGYTRYIGASAMKAVEFAQLQFIAEQNNWTKFISMQNYYNLIYREEEREMIPFCNDNEFGRVGLIPYSPIARGILARPVDVKSNTSRNSDSDAVSKMYGLNDLKDFEKQIINRVEELSKKYNVCMTAIAANWLMRKGAAPIIGLSSEKRIEEACQAVTFKLTEEEIKYLEEPYKAKASQF